MESFNPFNLRLSRSSRRHEASENKRDLWIFLIHRLLLGVLDWQPSFETWARLLWELHLEAHMVV